MWYALIARHERLATARMIYWAMDDEENFCVKNTKHLIIMKELIKTDDLRLDKRRIDERKIKIRFWRQRIEMWWVEWDCWWATTTRPWKLKSRLDTNRNEGLWYARWMDLISNYDKINKDKILKINPSAKQTSLFVDIFWKMKCDVKWSCWRVAPLRDLGCWKGWLNFLDDWVF